jgi:hypothetical protein
MAPQAEVRDLAVVNWKRYPTTTFVDFEKPVQGAPVFPSVQVGVASTKGLTVDERLIPQSLELQVSALSRAWEHLGVEIREASTTTVDGHQTALVVAELTQYRRVNGFQRPYRILSRNYCVYAWGLAYPVTMTSSVDPRFFNERDFETILRSIEIKCPWCERH